MRRQEGFTLIELIVTLTLGTALMIAFFTLFRFGITMSSTAARQEVARNLAYEGVRKYSQAQPVGWSPQFDCKSSGTPLTDGVASGGQTIETTDVSTKGLPAPATLVVKATAPYGCSGANINQPILVEATVQYGTPSQKVVYATYAKK